MRRTPLRRKPPKPKKKTTASSLRAKADRLAREACVSRGVCEAAAWPGIQNKCSGRLEWAHIKSRGPAYYSIRHDPLNCVCLCSLHHRWFHSEPDKFYRFIEWIDAGRWDYLNSKLNERSSCGHRMPLADVYRSWIDHYTKEGMNDPDVR